MTYSKDEAIDATKTKPICETILGLLLHSSNSSYKAVARHNKLLSLQTDGKQTKEQQTKAGAEFNELYMRHASKFQRLHQIAEANLAYLFTHPKLESKKTLYESRKNNLLSNIKYHFTNKEAEVSIISILIVVGVSLAFSGILVGLISALLFITMNVAPLTPLILLTMGTIGLITGLTAANLDRRQAEEQFKQTNQELKEAEKNNSARYSEVFSLNIFDIAVNNDGNSKSNKKQLNESDLHSLLFPKLKQIDMEAILRETANESQGAYRNS